MLQIIRPILIEFNASPRIVIVKTKKIENCDRFKIDSSVNISSVGRPKRTTNPQKEGETGNRTLTVPLGPPPLDVLRLFVLEEVEEEDTVELVPEVPPSKEAAEEEGV